MLRVYEIENNVVIQKQSTKFAPANSLVEFQQFSKNTNFVEQLHEDAVETLASRSIDDFQNKSASIASSPKSDSKRLSRSYVSATYLPRMTEFALQMRLFRIPRRMRSQQMMQFELDAAKRSLIALRTKSSTRHADLIISLAQRYMPRTYIEGFSLLGHTPKPWRGSRSPKVIFTANRHLYDDSFNYWAAHAVENGARLVLAQHGGQFGISQFPSFSERHELSVSDRYLTWGWTSGKKCLPAFVFTCTKKPTKPAIRDGKLLVVTDQLWKYPRSIFTDLTDFSQYLPHLAKTLNGLPKKVKDHALIRIHHGDTDAGAPQKSYWNEHCPEIKHDSGQIDFTTRLLESRLVLIAHNGTTIPECFAQNFPIVITWSDSYMIVRESAKEAFDALEKVGVFHRYPESAAAFIGSVWDDVDGWWNSHDVISARNQFTNQFARSTEHPVKFMVKALRF